MKLAGAGLGSANPAAAPKDINSLIAGMNPLAAMMGGGRSGMNPMKGPGGPHDPEKLAEQREDMMMRAMMHKAMSSMMAPRPQPRHNGTSHHQPQQQNSGMDLMTMMALQNGLGGAGGAGGSMDPMAMMMSMNPAALMGGSGGGGLFGGSGGMGGMLGGLGGLSSLFSA